jgi:hypothetical protein
VSTIDRIAIRPVAVERAQKLAAAIGHPDMSAFARAVVAVGTSADLERIVQAATGPAGFMEMAHFDSEKCSGRSWATAPRRACASSSAIR